MESGLLASLERDWALIPMHSRKGVSTLRRCVNVAGSGSVYGGRGALVGSQRLLAMAVTL